MSRHLSVDHDAVLRFLVERIDYERATAMPYGKGDFALNRMHELLARIGNPQTGLPVVHVAGTKGKGSTAAMIAAMTTTAGFCTGLYTSPHLERVEERLAVDGRRCPDAEFVDLIRRIQPAVAELDAEAAAAKCDRHGPTYFEIVTAVAWLHFADRQADLGVFEVGLGGRLDSTNVCQPQVTVITSISFDHMRQLGHTLQAIAGEKAGIIKPGVPVVSGVMAPQPQAVIAEVAARQGCRLIQLGRDFTFDYYAPEHLEAATGQGQLDFHFLTPGHEHEIRGLALPLLGEHQGANAATALASLIELRRQGWRLPDEAMRRGLAALSWPARVEVLSRNPTVVLDAAHNVASIEALVGTLRQSFSAANRLLIFATTRDKDIDGMLRAVLPAFDRVIFTRYANNPRAVPPEELAAAASTISRLPQTVCPDAAQAWDEASRLATPGSLIGVTGSFFIAAEMRRLILAATERRRSPVEQL